MDKCFDSSAELTDNVSVTTWKLATFKSHMDPNSHSPMLYLIMGI